MKLKKNIAISESGFVFDPGTGDSFSVNSTGMKILELLKEGHSSEEIIKRITDQYNIENNQVKEDFEDFIHHLRQLRMLEKDEA